jgi:hypothetical protein
LSRFSAKIHWLDNEGSIPIKKFNQEQHIEYQLVPPHMHCQNAPESAIRTCKITSLLAYAAPTANFECISGIILSNRPLSLSTFSAPHDAILASPHLQLQQNSHGTPRHQGRHSQKATTTSIL